MAGDPLHIHADLQSAPVTAVDPAVGGLGGDDELDAILGSFLAGEIFVDDVLPAHAVAVLFLGGADHHDFIIIWDQVQILHDFGDINSGCHAALLIGAAATKDDVFCFISLIGIGFPVVDISNATVSI